MFKIMYTLIIPLKILCLKTLREQILVHYSVAKYVVAQFKKYDAELLSLEMWQLRKAFGNQSDKKEMWHSVFTLLLTTKGKMIKHNHYPGFFVNLS